MPAHRARRDRRADCQKARWRFTLQQPNEDEKDRVREWPLAQVKYLVVSEDCEQGGQCLLNGFVNTVKRQNLRQMQEFLPRADWEPARGTDAENQRDILSRGRLFVQIGTPFAQGARTDLWTSWATSTPDFWKPRWTWWCGPCGCKRYEDWHFSAFE